MRFLRDNLKQYWPLYIVGLTEAILVATNVPSASWLWGWDHLSPELNPLLNLKRTLFGAWLEYRGTGVVDGMSHIANLVHTILVGGASFVVPAHFLRYGFIMGMHVLGGIGTYLLLRFLLSYRHAKNSVWLSFIGAIFYLFNIAVVQMFYAPLEAFAVHFAALPWLSWSLMRYLTYPQGKTLFFFAAILFLTTPQFFVTTLIIPVGILLILICVTYFLHHPHTAKAIFAALATFICVNAFWLFPYLWSIPKSAPIITAAKINQMSSEEAFARNQAFGDLFHTLSLQGFSLDYEDIGNDRTFTYMMEPWRVHLSHPIVQILIGAIVAVMVIGLLFALTHTANPVIIFSLTAMISFLFLGNDIPYVRNLTMWLQTHIPFFKESFRFPFTKFSLLYALSYSILFTYGLSELVRHEHSDKIKRIVFFGVTFALLLMSAPSFTGHFLYKQLHVQIPEEYSQLFSYMNTQDPNGRIALLPQPSFWSWRFYDFGYRGSGFLWYGLPQPVLDRAFDPWSQTNENYYWELSYALYTKNPTLFLSVVDKYRIRYLLLDEHIISADNDRSLFTQETKELLEEIPAFSPLKTVGKLTVYEYANYHTQSSITLAADLPSVNSYAWTDNDRAYATHKDYMVADTPTLTYPFRDLFTKRSVSERGFTIEETPDTLTVHSPAATSASMLKKDTLAYDSDIEHALLGSSVIQCGLLKPGKAIGSNYQESDQIFLRMESIDQRGCTSFTIPTLSHKEGYVVAVESKHKEGRPLLISFINETARHTELETHLPTFSDWNTSYFILPPLAPDGLGYTVYVANDSIGSHKTVNDLRRVRFYTIPYTQLVDQHIGSTSTATDLTNTIRNIVHPFPSWYHINLSSYPANTTLMLAQTYDTDWIALTKTQQFPYIAPVNKHILINNWSNGWILPEHSDDTTIYLLFWPQLLQYIGLILLPIPFVFSRQHA